MRIDYDRTPANRPAGLTATPYCSFTVLTQKSNTEPRIDGRVDQSAADVCCCRVTRSEVTVV